MIRRSVKVFAAICVALVAGYFILNFVIQKKIRQEFNDLPPTLQIKFSKVHINLFSSSVSFDSLSVQFAPYNSRPQNKHQLYFPGVSIKGISFLSFLFSKNLKASTILLKDGNIQLDEFLLDKKDSAQASIFQDIKLPFKKLFARDLIMTNLNSYLHSDHDDRGLAKGDIVIGGFSVDTPGTAPAFKTIDVRISGINYPHHDFIIQIPHLVINSRREIMEIDSLKLIPRSKDQYGTIVSGLKLEGLDVAKSINKQSPVVEKISIGKTKVSVPGYSVELREAEYNEKQKRVKIKGLSLVPLYGKYEFGKKLGHQADRIEASVSIIEITNPDIEKLLQQKLIAEKIKVDGTIISIFRDRTLPRTQKIIPLPSDYLENLPFDVRINSFELSNAMVAYEEFPKAGYGKTGTLRIEKISANLAPLINHPLVSDAPYISMDVNGSLMGSGTAQCNVMMPLQKNKPYHIKGKIEKLELTKLNSSSENLGKIRIKSGFLDFLSFDFIMTEIKSTGKIVGAYHHLVIEPLKKHTEEKNVADFASFMLRHLVIPPDKDKSLAEDKRTGFVDYQRDPTRMVSYYFLQSLLMGVKKSFKLGFLLPK